MDFNTGTVTSVGGLLVGRQSSDTAGQIGVAVQKATATVTVNGASSGFDASTYVFQLSKTNGTVNGESSYTLIGGTLTIPNANTRIFQWGKFAGYGTVSSSGRELNNSGRVVADGYDMDRDFDLSSYGSVVNAYSNGTERTGCGWYAVNKGKLVLPGIPVAAGDSTVYVGESGNLDLVNAVQVDFEGVSAGGGTLAAALLATNRTDASIGSFDYTLAVYEFTIDVGFSLATVTFRYDDALAASLGVEESGISVYRRVGGHWETVTFGSVDEVNKTVSAQVSTLSQFAVGFKPPEGTVISIR